MPRILHLEVRADNAAAIGLYQAMGFAADGRRRDYYGRGHDALLMSLRIAGMPARCRCIHVRGRRAVMADEPLVLGIETSCDETGVGIVRGMTLLADVVASSVEEHARFGGVVPEVASRAHLEAMVPTLEAACRRADVRLADIDAVAVTAGPGLAGALLVGVAAAKALSLSLGVAPVRRESPRRPRRRRRPRARTAGRADDGPAGLGRALVIAPGPRCHV